METALKIHNLTEDLVKQEVDKICAEIENSDQGKEICTCGQCRLDAACYVLNRTKPRYIVSNRGIAHLEQDPIARNQEHVDITVLTYRALKQVAHNQRPFFSHSGRDRDPHSEEKRYVFNLPAIIGRLFNGINFEPMSGIEIELRHDGKLAAMRDANWQNPFTLVENTSGTFTFWPTPIEAEGENERELFEFSIRIKADGFETTNHYFEIPVVSEEYTDMPFSMDRTYKLRDLYLFPEEQDEPFSSL